MTKQTPREQLIALQDSMKADQLEAAYSAKHLLMDDQLDTMLKELADLREKTIPGQYVEQIINNVTQVIFGVRKMLENNIKQDEAAGVGQTDSDS